MHQNTFDGRAPPEPAGGAYSFPKIPSRSGGLLIRKGREGEGPTDGDSDMLRISGFVDGVIFARKLTGCLTSPPG